MTIVTLRLGDRTVAARIGNAGAVQLDNTSFTVTPAGPGIYAVDDGSRRWRVAVAGDGETLWASADGQVAVVEIETGATARPRKRTAAGDAMMAPMPATVVKVLVKAGQSVRESETLLVLEAMKMELPIRAPRDGVVNAVHCEPGELVQPGVALVDMT
jgi:biotin carboxyl carrier protein